ncbi:MAG TPA: putative toxin-antitoxin system toxin component, PIN family [Candidatus Dormibacteraeota bacterium]|nr:putative toxin-antitoxin system toxin component, PIN family [Candidatus Dormibacteraeota bacterium]
MERGALPRLVIDTNVFVSGLISGEGPPARILRAVRDKRAVHLVSDPIVEEYLRVLDYPRIRKFRNITDAFVADIAAYLVYQTERVELRSQIRMSADPDDDVFLNTAVDGRATLLVSGDKTDLLGLRSIEGIPIASAREAVERIEG